MIGTIIPLKPLKADQEGDLSMLTLTYTLSVDRLSFDLQIINTISSH